MYYYTNIPKALNDLFPALKIDNSKMWRKCMFLPPIYLSLDCWPFPSSPLFLFQHLGVELVSEDSFLKDMPKRMDSIPSIQRIGIFSQERRYCTQRYAHITYWKRELYYNTACIMRKREDLICLSISSQGAKMVIAHHQNSVSKALLDLFPHIGLNRSKLWIRCMFVPPCLRFSPILPQPTYLHCSFNYSWRHIQRPRTTQRVVRGLRQTKWLWSTRPRELVSSTTGKDFG